MSSYLNLYLQDKTSEKKQCILSSSRSSDLYQTFKDSLNVPYSDNGENYTKITSVAPALQEVKDSINRMEKRLAEYEKHVQHDSDLIDEILNIKEYISNQQTLLGQLTLIEHILSDISLDCTDFEGLYANID